MEILVNQRSLMRRDDMSYNLDGTQVSYCQPYSFDPLDPQCDVGEDDAQNVAWIYLFHADRKHLPPSNLVGRSTQGLTG
jgi:hypothetical protein